MIGELKPYPEMTDSGAAWLGQVPAHWSVLPNRAIFTEVKERGHPEADMLSVTITRGVVRQQDLLEGSAKRDGSNPDKSAYKLVHRGDIAYNKMRAWQGAVGVSEYEGIVSPAYVVQRPRDCASPRYLHYLSRTPAFAREAERWSFGITSDMWSLRPEHFKLIYSCLPALAEQVGIVSVVDHVDRRIRRYIRAKQKLIKLLEEQKQAIIHRAVIRGLDPNVRLTPSGVEWLGEVPEHWEVMPLKRVARFKSGAGFPLGEQGKQVGEIPFLRVSDMNRPGNEVWIERPDSMVSGQTAQQLRAFVLPAGTIIFPKVGGALLTNKRRLLRKPSCIDNNMMGCVPTGADVLFMFALLARMDFGRLVKPGPVPAISEGELREIEVAIPPRPEQTAIVNYVNEEKTKIDAAIAAYRRRVGLLEEFRTRLIADVVTGKLDVREVAAGLPEGPEESEQFLDAGGSADMVDMAAAEFDAIPEEAQA